LKALWVRYRRDLNVLLVLLALPLGLFWETTIGGKTLIPTDNLYQWEPWATYAAQMGVGVPHNELLSDLLLENYAWKRFALQSLRQPGGLTNRLPLWNPYLWAGAPFLADGQHSAMYPLSILFYVLPLPAAYGWFTALQFWLAGVSMYILARTLGTNRVGGLLAGIVYQLSSVYVVSTVFTMIIAAMAWLPLLLALIERVIRQQMVGGSGTSLTLLYVVGGALALGCQMLAGHPEITYYTGLVMGIYALARLLKEVVTGRGRAQFWAQAVKAGLWLLLMVALGACIGAAQFVPLYEYSSASFRQGSESYETIVGWAFPKRRALAFVMPNFFGNPTHHAWFDILKWQWVPVGNNILGEPTSPPHTIYWGIKNAVEGGSYLGILPLFLALIAVVGRLRIADYGPRSGAERGRKHWESATGETRQPADAESSIASRKSQIADSEYRRSRFYVWLFAGLAAFSLSLVFGLPTYGIIFALPGINQLHSPFRWLFPYTLCVAVLAGFGTTYLSGTGRKTTSWQSPFTGVNTQRLIGWPALWAGVAGLVLLLGALPFANWLYPLAERAVFSLARAETAFDGGRMFFMYQWVNLFVFVLMLIGSGAVLRITRCPIYLPERLGGYAVWKPLALMLVALDLFIAGYGFNPASNPRWLDLMPPSIEYLKARQAEEPHFRITTFTAGNAKPMNANTPWLYDLQDARGYGSIISKQYVDYMSLISNQFELLYNRVSPISADEPWALDSPLLDLLNVRYVIATEEVKSPKYQLVYDGEVRIYENKGCTPRAFTLPDTSVVYSKDVAQTIQTYDPRHHVILEGADSAAMKAVAGVPQPASISRYTHNEVFVDVNLDAPGWLILADTYFPGWRAYVRPFGGTEADESELEIARHSGNFRAVRLGAGQHTVRFKYTPTSVKVGFFLSFLGVMVLALLLAIWLWQRYAGGGDGDSDAQRVAKNSIAPIVLQLFNKLIDVAFMMLALRILNPEGAGQYYFVVNVIVYTDIFINFGLNTYLQREVAKAKAYGNRYLGNAVLLRLGLCLAAVPLLALFVVSWQLFARLLATLGIAATAQTLDAKQIWALALFALGLLPANVAAALTALFQANERMEHPAAITVVSTTVKAVLGTAALLAGWGIVGLGGVSIVTNLITLTILLVLTVRLFFIPRPSLDRALLREMGRESWPLMVNNLLSMGFFKADVILLKAMQGDIALGLYSSVAYKVIDAINIVPMSFTFALFPLMSRYADASREAMHRAYKLAVRLLVIVALPVALALTTLAYPLSNVIGGSGYMPDSAIALQLMIWSIPLGFINSVTHYVLIALGRQRPLTTTFVVGLAFNVVANAICIPIWSYRASAAIHILSELVLLVAFYVLMRRDLPSVPWASLLWRPALSGALMGLTAWLLYGVDSLLATVAALSVYAIALWLLGISREPDMEVVRELLPGLDRLRRFVATRKGSQVTDSVSTSPQDHP
jgi:O-antigen/teichoic acid export membrane protein